MGEPQDPKPTVGSRHEQVATIRFGNQPKGRTPVRIFWPYPVIGAMK